MQSAFFMIDNYQIADAFSLLAKLMEIHGGKAFKIKTYSNAAYTIERLPLPLAEMNPDDIARIKGIGESTAAKIIEILKTGTLKALTDLIEQTPPGVLEMLQVKGLGPKKIATIWKEMEIESIGELLYACQENRLLLYKGFGEKTQKNIREAIEFLLNNKDSHLYADVEPYAIAITEKLHQLFPSAPFILTGEYRRQMEIIHQLEWVTTVELTTLAQLLSDHQFVVQNQQPDRLCVKGAENVQLCFHHAQPHNIGTVVFKHSCSEQFLTQWISQHGTLPDVSDETDIFKQANITPLPPFAREVYKPGKSWSNLVTSSSIRGIIHTHSNWSDGINTIEEMAKAAMEQGFEYLVISDHSKSAFYANGLSVERIREQHRYIDELNARMPSFRVFKSIEADILNDGSLDYDGDILSTFDLVIASVHSNLKMTEEKAMMRLMRAIENPYTTILGHMTGRLLLSRNGYPLDHKAIIDACVDNHVAIEINAHPRRLDLDWRWVDYALERGAILSINPDAHEVEGYKDVRYGVLVAQKGGLTAEKNLSSFSKQALENYLLETRKAKGI